MLAVQPFCSESGGRDSKVALPLHTSELAIWKRNFVIKARACAQTLSSPENIFRVPVPLFRAHNSSFKLQLVLTETIDECIPPSR